MVRLNCYLVLFLAWALPSTLGLVTRRFSDGKYRCRCDKQACDEDADDGSCLPHNGCEDPKLIGPSCLYLDAYKMWGKDGMPDLLSDQNDSTCLTAEDEFNGFLVINMVKPVFFTWIRIYALKVKGFKAHSSTWASNHSDPGEFRPDVSLSETHTPTYEITSRYENDFLLRVDDPEPYTEMTISSLPREICTVQISGGRNVLVEFKARQSSTAKDPKLASMDASRANDDIIQPGFTKTAACSRTRKKKNSLAWWEATLPIHEAVVHQYVLYNRKVGGPDLRCQLQRFTFKEYFATKLLGKYQESSTIGVAPKYDYDISIPDLEKKQAKERVRRIRISINPSDARRQEKKTCQIYGALELCEVEGYGEILCKNGKVGFSCDKTCDKCDRKKCDITFGCTRGCIPGFKGRYCEELCDEGYWGKECSRRCPKGCAKNCTMGRGECLVCVHSGLSGPFCEKDEFSVFSLPGWYLALQVILICLFLLIWVTAVWVCCFRVKVEVIEVHATQGAASGSGKKEKKKKSKKDDGGSDSDSTSWREEALQKYTKMKQQLEAHEHPVDENKEFEGPQNTLFFFA